MSKHEKQVRRNRTKREAARRSNRNPKSKIRHRGVAALAAAGALAAGTQAYAAPVRFNNPPGPDHFDWKWSGGDGEVLNILAGPQSQPGIVGEPGSFEKVPDGYGSGGEVIQGVGAGLFTTQLAAYRFLEPFVAMELVPPTPPLPANAQFAEGGYAYSTAYGPQYYAGGTLLPDGLPTYLGVRFDQGNGYQYGWIGVVRNGQETDAFAWGYETEPGVPIPAGAPEPGSLALLAFGAAGTMARRRRREA